MCCLVQQKTVYLQFKILKYLHLFIDFKQLQAYLIFFTILILEFWYLF